MLILIAAQRLPTLHCDAESVALGSFGLALELVEDQNAIVDEGLSEHRLLLVLKLLREIWRQDLIHHGLVPIVLLTAPVCEWSCALELLNKHEDVMLADIVLLSLHQKLEVELEVPWYDPMPSCAALLHEVGMDALVILRELHGVNLTELLAEDLH